MTAVHREIGDLLVDNGVITQEDLELVRAEHKRSGNSIVDLLSKLGLASESQLQNALELEYGVNYVDLLKSKTQPDEEAVRLLPQEFMRANRLVGLNLSNRRFTLAMVDPADSLAISAVQDLLPGMQIKPVVVVEDNLLEFLNRFFGNMYETPPLNSNGNANSNGHAQSNGNENSNQTGQSKPLENLNPENSKPENLKPENLKPENSNPKKSNKDEQAHDSPKSAVKQLEKDGEEAVALLANQILGGAIRSGATHIHISSTEREAVVNYRINGALVIDRKLPKAIVSSVIGRYKSMAKLVGSDSMVFDGHIKVKSTAKEMVCLLSIIPTLHGEHAVFWIV
jgi:type II secretory ATPase GspE/PulE/Tfp pilus assembly ATPase PilB-like protein